MEAPRPPDQPKSEPPDRREVDSQELMRGEKILVIRHAGEQYRLVVTRNNRLILQK